MSKDLPQPQQPEEVDLGQLFKLIGNAFDRLFRFIGSIFKAVYDVFLLLLIHIYKRLKWYASIVALGFIIGFVMDRNSDNLYGANIFIETNFNSSRQVYENIKQFNQLANIDNDSLELSDKLNISINDASKLKGFYIEPDIDENYIMELFSEFYLGLDSLSRSTITYKDYKESLNAYNFKIHRIGVASTDKFIYKKIQESFIDQISGNGYLKKLAKVNLENIKRTDTVLVQQVKKTDSLVKEYLKIRINESNKESLPGSGTNLFMGDGGENTLIVDESKIIQQSLSYESQRRELSLQEVEQKDIINVIADFPATGYDITEWYEKKKFLIPIVLFLITLIVFIGLGLGDYLKNQSERLNTNK